MEERVWDDLFGTYKNFVFIGESGSGKTELGINMAVLLAEHSRNVHFFDLDQTKPLFRARDAAGTMEAQGISVHTQEQFQDIPSMVPGIAESLQDLRRYTFLDIGGNVHGALMAGQLARYINTEDTCVFFVINVYRPWSRSRAHILETRDQILAACRVSRVRLVSNPNLGEETTAAEVLDGHRRLLELLGKEAQVDYVCVGEHLSGAAAEISDNVVLLHRYIRCGMTPASISGGQ